MEESEKNLKKIAKVVPEVRTWDLFTPKIYDKALHISSEKLRQNEAKFHTAIESLPFGFFMINKDGYYVMQNTVCKENWGNIIGKRPEDVANSKDTLAIWKENNLRAFSGEIVKSEIELKINERIQYFYNIITPVYIDDKIEYIQGVNIDTTDRKIADQKLKESEERYRLIYENTNDLIRVFNNNFEFEYLNEKVHKRVLEYSIEELANMDPISLFHPEDRKHAINRLSKILRKGEGSYEARFKHKDGHYKWLELSAKNFVDSKGNKKILSIGRDITDRKIIEQRIKESEEKYRTIADQSILGITIFQDDAVKYINQRGADLLGYTVEEITKWSSNEYASSIHPEDRQLVVEQVRKKQLRDPNVITHYQFRCLTKTGETIWVDNYSKTIDYEGRPADFVAVIDITGMKKAQQALKESEEKFHNILETSSVGVMELDVVKKKLLYINPKLLNIIGYKKEEITEDLFRSNLIHPKDLNKLLMTNEESELEFRIIDKQGKLKWLAGKRIPHFNENGEISSIRIWLDDITEKKMYENLIYELNINFLNFTTDIRNNIDLLLNTCLNLLDGDLILYIHKIISDDKENYQIISSDETYIYNSKDINQLFLSGLFYEEHDFPQTFFDIDRMKYAKTDPFIIEHKFKGSFGKVIKSNEGFNSAVCIFYKNNPIISGEDNLVLFLICDALEIEQRRWQVQKDLEKQNITLNKINKLKSELFSRTSHELKTPLISVKGFTELLLTLYKSKLDPEIISILEEISDGSKRLEKIINLLLDSTKLEAGQLSLNLQDENLTFLIKFCVKELQGLAKLRDQTISLNLQDKLETKFDKERIYEVISNLLVNAIKYTPPGGKITIESKKNEESYEISIKDNGIGFTEEEKNQVFRQFGKIERYGQGWDIAADGTGLGLYITKSLVELHGGKIWIESEGRNKGTTFHFSLPILK